MRINFLVKKIIALSVLLSIALNGLAQNGAVETKEVISANNLLAILLIVAAIILAVVIAFMSRMLINVGKLVLDKQKKSRQQLMTVFILLGCCVLSQYAGAEDPAIKTIPNYGGISKDLFEIFAAVVGAEFIVIIFLAFSIRRLYTELLPEPLPVQVKSTANLSKWWKKINNKILTRAVPVADESDVLLDHDYDGIKELNNPLPPWWKYGFYITIVVAIYYFFHFQVTGDGKNPEQEYVAELEQAKIEVANYEAANKNKVDEDNVPLADEAGIQSAKTTFLANCVSCHGEGGQGGAGPNLTDNYWLHKGSLNDIYQSIKHGYPDKGMQPWIVKFNPKEISQLASFVKSIHGSNPVNPKAPQGDLYVEELKSVKTDSLKHSDSAALVKQIK
ncbi:MAG: cbb3-type cytochrome c oxidase N-terminal domain-containing protein [Ferruginibacter sp.]